MPGLSFLSEIHSTLIGIHFRPRSSNQQNWKTPAGSPFVSDQNDHPHD